MISNFSVIKDLKNTKKYSDLEKSLEKKDVRFLDNLTKLKSYNIYSSEVEQASTGKKIKAIWTKFETDNLVLLDIVKKKYENSKYIKNKQILEKFYQGGDRITSNIKEKYFEESFYKLGKQLEENVYFTNRKVVKLNESQESILQKNLESGFYVLSGIAGSGKTSIAYLKLKEIQEISGNYLFTTGSSNLANSLKTMFSEEVENHKVKFFGYKDLVDQYYDNVSHLKKVGLEEFSNYLKQTKLLKVKLSDKELYSLIQYIAVKPDVIPSKRDFFKEIEQEDFKQCLNLYSNYLNYLKEQDKIDLSLSKLKLKNNVKPFDYIIVDESQDLSPREIENINLLRDKDFGTIMFNVDSNQHSNISLPVNYLKSHEDTKEIISVLDSSFRMPKDVVQFAQGIIDARSFVMKGVVDKDMVKDFSSVNFYKGNIAHINIKESQKLKDSSNVAIVVFDKEDKLEVQKLLPDITQVFTSHEIKGLEYNTVIVYSPYEKFTHILSKNHKIKWDKSEVKSNLPKDINNIDHNIKILFNNFFTAVSRTNNNLYIVEKNPEDITEDCLKFKKYLMKDIKEGDLYFDNNITDTDWINQITTLVTNDSISQAINIYEKKKFDIEELKKNKDIICTHETYLISVLSDMGNLDKIPSKYIKSSKFNKGILKYKPFTDIPDKYKTIDLCKAAVDINIKNILYVPNKYSEVYEYFLKKFENSLKEIPKECITESVAKMGVIIRAENLKYLSKKQLTYEVCKAALLNYEYSLKEFPKEFVEPNFAQNAVKLKVTNLMYLSKGLLTYEVCKSALSNYEYSLKNFPKDLINHELAKTAVKIDLNNMEFLPDKFKNKSLYISAIKYYGDSLEQFPKKFINEELSREAVKINAYNLKYLPKRLVTYDMRELALVNCRSLKEFPKNFIDKKLAEKAVTLEIYNLKYLPDEFINYDLYNLILKNYNNSLEKFPEELINYQLAKMSVKLQVSNLRYIPDKLLVDGMCRSILSKYENSLEKFPKDLIFPKLANIALELKINNIKYLPEKLLTFKMCKSLLSKYENSLEKFPKELLVYKLAKIAVNLQESNIKYLPSKLLTFEICRSVLSNYENSLEKFPKDLISYKLAKAAVKLDLNNLKFLPDSFKNENLYSSVLKQYNDLLIEFPEEFIDKKLAEEAVTLEIYNLKYLPSKFKNYDLYNLILQNYDNSLEKFPKELINYRLAKMSVKLQISNLNYLPEKFLGDDMCRSILSKYENSLEKFPKDLIFPKLANIAVNLQESNIKYLPNKLLTFEICKSVLSNYENSLEKFPKDLISYKLAKAAVKLDLNNLKFLPSSLKNENLYNSILKQYNDLLIEFPEEFIDKKLAEEAVKLNANNLSYLPSKLLTYDMRKLALTSCKNSLKEFPKKFIDQELGREAVRLDESNLNYLPNEFKIDSMVSLNQELTKTNTKIEKNSTNKKSLSQDQKIKNYEQVHEEKVLNLGENSDLNLDFEA